MAVTFVAAGAVEPLAVSGNFFQTIAYPAALAAGDLLVLAVVTKTGTPAEIVPGEWFLHSSATAIGGLGPVVTDQGDVRVDVYVKLAIGTETGTFFLGVTGAGAGLARVFAYRGSGSWSLGITCGSDNTAGTGWSVTGAADPGITAGDVVLVVSGLNTDGPTYSAEAIAASGVTVWGAMVEQQDSGTSFGEDVRLVVSQHAVTTGTSAGAPTFTMTASATTTNAPTGGSVFLRMRQVTPPADYGREAELYAETWTEHVRSAGQVAELYAETWTEHVKSAGQVAELFAEVWTEGPWTNNSPSGKVAEFYAEVWAEYPSFPTQYRGLQFRYGGLDYELCLVALADRSTGMGGTPAIEYGGLSLPGTSSIHPTRTRRPCTCKRALERRRFGGGRDEAQHARAVAPGDGASNVEPPRDNSILQHLRRSDREVRALLSGPRLDRAKASSPVLGACLTGHSTLLLHPPGRPLLDPPPSMCSLD